MPLEDERGPILTLDELAEQLAVPAWWIESKRFDLPAILHGRDTTLKGVRVSQLEHWQRAARIDFPNVGVGA